MRHCLDVENVECILDVEGLVPAEPSKQPSIVRTIVEPATTVETNGRLGLGGRN